MAKKVLIVDDDRMFRGMLASAIQQFCGADIEVCQASGGEEALGLIDKAHAEDKPFRVVVSDGQMLGMNGIELITRLRANSNHADEDIVMYTGANEAFCQTALSAGASCVIRKPGLMKLMDYLVKALES